MSHKASESQAKAFVLQVKDVLSSINQTSSTDRHSSAGNERGGWSQYYRRYLRTKGVTCACCMGSRPSAGSDDPLKSKFGPEKS